MESRRKVFGVGLNKTGTSTLGECAEILGYRVVGCRQDLLRDAVVHRRFDRVHATVEANDLFQDWPWPLIFRELDEAHPGSKFVLTLRESPECWLASLKAHALRTSPTDHCRDLAYGFDYPHGHEQEHLDIYARHNDAVRAHFADRPGDLLVLCWETGDGWSQLCEFLGEPTPDRPLPHAMRGATRRVDPARRRANAILSELGRRRAAKEC